MKEERHKQINHYIDSKGEATLLELHELFPQCSMMTLRRDLIQLEQEGRVKRMRGGAIAIKRILGREDAYRRQLTEKIQGKMMVAKACLPLLNSGSSLFIDAGNTMMCLAQILPNSYRPIITCGVNIALELSKKPDFTVTILGGQIDNTALDVSGQISLMALEKFNIDTAILTPSGFTVQDGFSTGIYAECDLKRAIIAKANRVIMLVDSSKIGRSMPLTFANMKDIDIFVTEKPINESLQKACEEANVQCVIASEEY